MSIDNDIARIAQQEEALQFPHFDAATAWEIGTRLREAAVQRKAALAIEVRVGGQLLFFHAMPGTTPDNADWIRRKVNTVQQFHRSSYATGLRLARDQTDLTTLWGLPARDYAAHGGAFPIRVGGSVVGVVTVSGLPQREDHALVVEVLARHLGKPLDGLALDD